MTAPAPELHRPLALGQIPPGGLAREIVATPAECTAVARRLMIPGVAALSCDFRLTPAGDGTVLAQGRLTARVTRECVITLELFDAEIAELFRVRFVPELQLAELQLAEVEDDLLDLEGDDEIGYAGSHINLGEAAVEQLALALDPYPRMPGATLEEGDEAEESTASPFSALARRAPRG